MDSKPRGPWFDPQQIQFFFYFGTILPTRWHTRIGNRGRAKPWNWVKMHKKSLISDMFDVMKKPLQNFWPFLAFLTLGMHEIPKNLNIIIVGGTLSQYSHRNNLWTILANNSHCVTSNACGTRNGRPRNSLLPRLSHHATGSQVAKDHFISEIWR